MTGIALVFHGRTSVQKKKSLSKLGQIEADTPLQIPTKETTCGYQVDNSANEAPYISNVGKVVLQ